MRIIVKENIQEGYTYYLNPSAKENFDLSEKELKKEYHGSLGKYQFFSDDRNKLVEIAKKVLLEFHLFNAKISKTKRETTKGFGYGLFVYDYKPRYKYEMKKYADEINLKYRYWKSDADTLKGSYSEQFLRTLPPEEREEWTRNKIK